jgi:tetratricopeptide (TPR) repeat protein
VTLGQQVRAARKSRGLTQRQLAGGDLSESFISMLEHDKVRPSLETLRILASRLDVALADLVQAEPPPRRQVGVKLELGRALLRQHRFTEAMEAFQEAERAAGADASAQTETRFRIHIGLGQALTGMGQYELAEGHLVRSQTLAAALGRPDLVARVASATGYLSLRRRDLPAARDAFARGLHALRTATPGDAEFEAALLNNLGRTYSDLGLPAQALECLQAALGRIAPLGDLVTLGLLHFNLGVTHERQQAYERAREHLEKAAALFEAQESLRLLGTVKRSLGILLINRGQAAEGAEVLHESLVLADQTADDLGRAQTLTELARASLMHGNVEAARAQAEEAIRLSVRLQDPAEAARAESVMAAVCHREGRVDEAAHRYAYALREFERLQAADEVARVGRDYAFLLLERGDEVTAARLFAKAFRAQDAALTAR